MKLLIDVNLSPAFVELLVSDQIQPVHWSSIGPGNAPDTSIMSFANVHSYVILTNDLDFGEILAATNAAGPSVVQLRTGDSRPDVVRELVIQTILDNLDNLERGALITIHPTRTRVSALSLK